jgi:hypothetical protein
MEAAFALMHANRCRFLVAGRLNNGNFCTLDDIVIPARLADLFAPIPATQFRADISSSQIRAQEHS